MIKQILTNINVYFALLILVVNNILNTGKNQLVVNIIAVACLVLIIGGSIFKYKITNEKKNKDKKNMK